jgi:hypothetical protein
VNASIVRVTRGDAVEVYRIALRADGSATLERFENGGFAAPRIFRRWDRDEPSSSGSAATSSRQMGSRPMESRRMDRAIRHISVYLDGAVTVGERDLLSPASAMTRNLRWFPGDLQMLETTVAYVRELFPSAQFHVTLLLRRVFGDVAFLALIVASSAFWLQTDSPVGSGWLGVSLLVVSMLAIVGLDGYVEPMRRAWRQRRRVAWRGRGLEVVYRLPLVIVVGLWRGSVSVVLGTVIGMTNLVINPHALFESWRSLRSGKSLEWKASSVSAGQDVRGWPLAEFVDTYRPARRTGLGLLAFLAWLIALGAPLRILGLTGLGVFVASFVTATLFAWYAALPRGWVDGAPRYELPGRELGALALAGVVGLALSTLLFGLGLYPLPAFEGSVALVALFVSFSAAFAIVCPIYYRTRFAAQRAGMKRLWRVRGWASVGVLCLGACSAYSVSSLSELSLSSLSPSSFSLPSAPLSSLAASPLGRAFHDDEAAWRMPEAERRVYEDVQRSMRRHGHADPEPLLRAEGTLLPLKRLAPVATPDLREPEGLPSPRLPRISLATARELPELAPLQVERRLPMIKPARQFTVPPEEPEAEAPIAQEVGLERTAAAQRRALALTPRALSSDELRAQDDFIEHADYPWIARDELRRLSRPEPGQGTVPLIEMARAERWDIIRPLWGRVEAAERGSVPDRVLLHRLRQGVEGVIALGGSPTAEQVQHFLNEELALIAAWSKRYPGVPLSSLDGEPAAATRGRFFEVTRFLLDRRLPRQALEGLWRLDYVNAFWAIPSATAALHQAFRERVRREPWERLELDWQGNDALRQRWEDLQTEQAVATKIWRAAVPEGRAPSTLELREIVLFLERVLTRVLERSSDSNSPYASLAELFRLEGVDARALESGDTVAALLASRVWTRAMAGRVAQIVSKSAAGVELPGTEADRAIVQATARLRYPDAAGDPMLRRVFEWLVLVDGAETYRELAAGYDAFAREARDLGLTVQGLGRAPKLSDAQLYRDLTDVWRDVPRRFPALPVRDDMVAEFLCQTAYFSSRDGHTPRTPRELVDDFAEQLSAVDARMASAPPPAIQRLTDRYFEKVQGRASRSGRGRRFFAWWMVAVQAEVLEHDAERRGAPRRYELEAVAGDWAGVLEAGVARYRHLPWFVPGFAEYFLNLQAALGTTSERLLSEFDRQLRGADQLMAEHTVPFRTFEAIVDRRIQERTGSVNFDPTLRRANALVALSELCQVLARNGLGDCQGNPALVTEKFSLLYEKLARDYPLLDWDSEGLVEFYLLTQLRQGWELHQTVQRFDADWSLANALAGQGLLARFVALAARPALVRSPEDETLARFISVQAERLEQKTGARISKPRSRAMNALLALSSLVQSAAEEGLLSEQHGSPWSKDRVRDWAGGLTPATFDPATATWAVGLIVDWASLLDAMREAGPHFPWRDGSIIESYLLSMRRAGATPPEMSAGMGAAWRAASDLMERRVAILPAFEALVREDAMDGLRRKLARARGTSPDRIADAEVEPEDPRASALDAVLALADVVATVRRSHHDDPDPGALARRIVEVRRLGPARYEFLPWREKGFVPSLIVAAHGPDFADDFWKYTSLVQFSTLNALLGELRAPRGVAPPQIPAEVLADVRSALERETGRTPASEPLIVLSALQGGVQLLREFLPELPVTLDNVITVVRVRARLRALGDDYSELGIVRAGDHSLRTGFADRLAALAMKRGLAAGASPEDVSFTDRALSLVEAQFLSPMQHIYASVRASLPAEEIDYYRELISDEARLDNPERAARHRLAEGSLSVPDVKTDDIVADAALYEILYANEIGQDRRYLSTLFDIFGRIQRRPAQQREYRNGLAQLDARHGAITRGAPGHDLWRTSSGYRRWSKERGDFIKSSRGRVIGLARTFALVERAAFERDSGAVARASFARFGSFDQYLERVMHAYEVVADVPELATALSELRADDPYLSDGVQFALALFACHVLERIYPEPEASERALRGIGGALPHVLRDQRRVLGFVPRLETGVPLYDARRVFLREQIEPGPGTGLLYRLELMQRGVQRWSEAHLLQQAYKVLFFRELDTNDPTLTPAPELPAALRLLQPALDALAKRGLGSTRGDETREFLEQRLPALLEAHTGSKSLETWLGWLMEHGELGVDGRPTGENPYALEVRKYEERLAHYRSLVERGQKTGRSVRAEQQRVRDIEREYGSFRRQVARLRESAASHAARVGVARRRYGDAIALHAFLPLGIIALCRRGAGWGANRLPLRRRRLRAALPALGLWLSLAAALGLPCFVALDPERAARLSEPGFQALALLGRDSEGRLEPRGAAAQLGRLEPWRLLARDR